MFTYIDDGGATCRHDKPLKCVSCGTDKLRLFQRNGDSGTPLNVSRHGTICQQCLIDLRVFYAQRRMDTDKRELAHEKHVADIREALDNEWGR